MGDRVALDHTAYTFDHPGLAAGGPWALDLVVVVTGDLTWRLPDSPLAQVIGDNYPSP